MPRRKRRRSWMRSFLNRLLPCVRPQATADSPEQVTPENTASTPAASGNDVLWRCRNNSAPPYRKTSSLDASSTKRRCKSAEVTGSKSANMEEGKEAFEEKEHGMSDTVVEVLRSALLESEEDEKGTSIVDILRSCMEDTSNIILPAPQPSTSRATNGEKLQSSQPGSSVASVKTIEAGTNSGKNVAKLQGPLPGTSGMQQGTASLIIGGHYCSYEKISTGGFSKVYKAADMRTNEQVALKLIDNAYESNHSAQNVYREVKFLWNFRLHPNVVRLHDIVEEKPDGHVYIVMELMDKTLGDHLFKKPFTADECQYISFQLLSAVRYLHGASVVHRDIKPENILLGKGCKIKICDFNIARKLSAFTSTSIQLSAAVGTLCYAAPEVVGHSKWYGKAVDIWSVGVILVELQLGKRLMPSTNETDHMEKILSLLPEIAPGDVKSLKVNKSVEEKYLRLKKKAIRGSVLARIANRFPADLQDLYPKMISFIPRNRCSIEVAITHPYVAKYFDPTKEPVLQPNDLTMIQEWKLFPKETYRRHIRQLAKTLAQEKEAGRSDN